MSARIMGGDYYAVGFRPQMVDVAREVHTLDEARRALEDSGMCGHIVFLDPLTGQRSTVAELKANGEWWVFNPFTRNIERMDPPARKTAQGSA